MAHKSLLICDKCGRESTAIEIVRSLHIDIGRHLDASGSSNETECEYIDICLECLVAATMRYFNHRNKPYKDAIDFLKELK